MSETQAPVSNEPDTEAVVVVDGVRYRGQPHVGRNRHETRSLGTFTKTVRRPAKPNPMPIVPKKHTPYRKVQP